MREKDLTVTVVHQVLGLKQVIYKFQCVTQIYRGCSSRLKTLNILALLLADVLLGCLVSYYLVNAFPNLFDLLLSKVELLLNVILELLQWLRGSPAGFKLNAALNSLLCRFFSYHLHLWRNYIGIIEPILSGLLSAITYVGCLGVTVQIAVVKDTLTIATFHIYCLYIYATRLFNVQRNTVISLGRLFFGKKWNPLRQRVDSVHLTISEMFLGSLGFTIGMFLFPTTLLYYVVFLGLRLPVRLLEFILRTTIESINSLEIVTVCLVWINSPIVADDVYFQPKYVTTDGKSTVTFDIRTFSTKSMFSFPSFGNSFKQTLKEICQGVVVHE